MSEFYLGMAHIALGRHAEAIRQADARSPSPTACPTGDFAAYASFLKGWALDASGRHAQAIDAAAAASTLRRTRRATPIARDSWRSRGSATASWKGAAALRSACEQIVLIGFIPFEILFAAWLSEAECRAGLAQLAQTTAQAAIDRAGDCPYPYGEAHARARSAMR